MKRLLLCLMVLLPVVTVHASSNWFFATEVHRSDYWRATQTTPVEMEYEFTTGEEEQATFISGEDELFISGEDDHTAPVEIEELFVEDQAEPVDELTTDEPVEEDENNHVEQAAGVIITPDEIEDLSTPTELEDIEEQEELTTDVEIEGES